MARCTSFPSTKFQFHLQRRRGRATTKLLLPYYQQPSTSNLQLAASCSTMMFKGSSSWRYHRIEKALVFAVLLLMPITIVEGQEKPTGNVDAPTPETVPTKNDNTTTTSMTTTNNGSNPSMVSVETCFNSLSNCSFSTSSFRRTAPRPRERSPL